jgi:hypothetical protein
MLLKLLVPAALIVCEQTIDAGADWGISAFAGQTLVVETIGIEPMTPCLQSRCSPS